MRFLRFLWGLLPKTKKQQANMFRCIQCRVPQPLWYWGRVQRDVDGIDRGICKICMTYKTNNGPPTWARPKPPAKLMP